MRTQARAYAIRLLALLLLLVLSVVPLPSCDSQGEGGAQEPMEQLQTMFGADYTRVTMTVTTRAADVLQSRFELTRSGDGVLVDYTAQVVAKFDLVDGVIVVPEGERIRTVRGSATVNGSTVTQQSGDPCPYDLAGVGFPSYAVNGNTLQVLSFGGGSFQLSITDPDAFFGYETGFDGNVTLAGLYTEGRLVSLELSAMTAKGQHTVQYTFS